MRVPNWISFVCIMIAIAIGVAIAIMLSDIATVKAGWCDHRPACFREWIGALSGWVAAAGALIAALLTVPHLRDQAGEAKRQTEFLRGEAMPSLDAVEHLKNGEELVVRVNNWNRRNMLIHDVDIVGFRAQVGVLLVEVDGRVIPSDIVAKFQPPISVKGWIDRNKAPHFAKIRILAAEWDEPNAVTNWDRGAQVAVTVRLIGPQHQKMVLYGEILPATTQG